MTDVEPLADSVEAAMRRLASPRLDRHDRHDRHEAARGPALRHGRDGAVPSLTTTPPPVLACVNGAACIHDPIGASAPLLHQEGTFCRTLRLDAAAA